MLKTVAFSPRNRLLNALTDDEFSRIVPHLKSVELPSGKIIYEFGEAIEYVYFPEDSIISTVTSFEDGTSIETAITGREGITGFHVALANVETARETVVQSGGSGWQMPTRNFLSLFEHGEVWRRLVLNYAFTFFEQVAQSGACINHHPVNQRLARWLLMCHDRTDGDNLHITQEFTAQMLGVNRPTVTAAAMHLRELELIDYTRGKVEILDRRGLENISCECYESIKKIYDDYLSMLELRRLTERMERTTDRMTNVIESRKTIQIETRQRIENLQRAVADVKNLPVRIRICEVCHTICDSRNNRRRSVADVIGKRVNAEFMAVVCSICAKNQ